MVQAAYSKDIDQLDCSSSADIYQQSQAVPYENLDYSSSLWNTNARN
jgi:hypothetical protein